MPATAQIVNVCLGNAGQETLLTPAWFSGTVFATALASSVTVDVDAACSSSAHTYPRHIFNIDMWVCLKIGYIPTMANVVEKAKMNHRIWGYPRHTHVFCIHPHTFHKSPCKVAMPLYGAILLAECTAHYSHYSRNTWRSPPNAVHHWSLHWYQATNKAPHHQWLWHPLPQEWRNHLCPTF